MHFYSIHYYDKYQTRTECEMCSGIILKYLWWEPGKFVLFAKCDFITQNSFHTSLDLVHYHQETFDMSMM